MKKLSGGQNNSVCSTSAIPANGFDIIRYWAAISVMFLHFTGFGLKLSTDTFELSCMHVIRYIVSFFPGVVVLFSLSGFLVAASFERSRNTKEYFTKRVFRLYPELWVCTLVNLLFLFLVAREYLDKSILVWMATQIVGLANTPSCLTNFATGSINGALWTIFTEIQLYIFLGCTYNWLKKRKMSQWVLILGTCVMANFGCKVLAGNGIFAKLIERIFVPYLLWFLIGAFCYIKRNIVLELLKKMVLPFSFIYILIRLCPYKVPGYYADLLVGIVCPFLVIALGFVLPKVRIKLDITYGMFLYHWIVLNGIVHFELFEKLPIGLTVAIFMVVTCVTAYLSRKYVGRLTNRVMAFLT